jgi:hypothetical protein
VFSNRIWDREVEKEWGNLILEQIVNTEYNDSVYQQDVIRLIKLDLDSWFESLRSNYPDNLLYKNTCLSVLAKRLEYSPTEPNKIPKLSFSEKFLLASKTTETKVLEDLLKREDRNFQLRGAMLGNPNLPEKLLTELLNKLVQRRNQIEIISDRYIRLTILQNLKIPSQFLEKMAQRNNDEWQLLVAEHPNTPTYLLEKYARSSNTGILCGVAKNPSTPHNILAELVTYGGEVLECVAQNPNTPEEIFRNLVNKSSYLLDNIHLPASILQLYAEESSNDLSLAIHPNTPIELLKKIALRADDRVILSCIAWHQNINVELLERLAENPDNKVRATVVRNSKTPPDILEKLADDEDEEVRFGILQNPNLTKEDFYRLSRKIYRSDRPSLGILLALLDPNVTPSFLIEKADSLIWMERYIVAIHPLTPEHIIQALTKDGNRYVRAAAWDRTNPNN